MTGDINATGTEALSTRTAIVLFGTETGTSQDIAHEIARILEKHRFETDVAELDDVAGLNDVVPHALSQYALAVFALSTTGQGDFPSNARKFWKGLRRKKLTSTFLSGVHYTIVGLGDSSYPKFNYAARLLHKRIGLLGAECLLTPCEADEQGEDSTDGAFIAWTQLFKTMLSTTFTLPQGLEPLPEHVRLPSKWTLERDAVENGVCSGKIDSMSPSNGANGHIKKAETLLEAVVEENSRVTPSEHWQDVRYLKLKTKIRADYYPGDVLAIRPKNVSQDVEDMISLMGWESIADQPLRCKLNRTSNRTARLPDMSLSDLKSFTLRQLLRDHLDINAIPRRSFFMAVSQYTQNEMHKERLLEFTDPQYLDEYYDYATRPRRSILEVLQEFDSVKIPWQEAINVFPMLRARQFSIASGGALKGDGSIFDLLVAIVKYKTVIKRIREGVCTRYLANLPVGSKLDVLLKTEGRLQSPNQLTHSKHLLVGAGTGIAPLRAIIHEKQMRVSSGPTWLIFGCRNAQADYFFSDEWQALANVEKPSDDKSFRVTTAFSRDQRHKVYVQDRIREHGTDIRRLLLDSDTTIVVCGSSGPMPKAIRQAFLDVLVESQYRTDSDPAFTISEAEKYLAELEKKGGRYKQETW